MTGTPHSYEYKLDKSFKKKNNLDTVWRPDE
jgi:hypothetical protein